MKLQLINKTEFNKLSAAQKRVAIAKDVLLRIKKKNIKQYQGDFFLNKEDIFEELDEKDSIQDAINSSQCEVCAKGALVCSWVGNFNKVKKEDIESFEVNLVFEDAAPKGLVKLFGRDMLDSIEYNFEGEDYAWTSHNALRKGYNKKYNNNLRAIMQNIIENEGKFIP